MNKIAKIIGGLILSAFMMFINITDVNAASASISVSSSTSKIVIGKTFTVTVKISSSSKLGSWEWVINYDTGKFKLTGGDTYVADFGDGSKTSASYKYTFKAIGTGSGSIGVKSYGGYAWDGNEKFSLSANSKSVKVITQADLEASYSKNNDLKNLEVEGSTLSPEFN